MEEHHALANTNAKREDAVVIEDHTPKKTMKDYIEINEYSPVILSNH